MISNLIYRSVKFLEIWLWPNSLCPIFSFQCNSLLAPDVCENEIHVYLNISSVKFCSYLDKLPSLHNIYM